MILAALREPAWRQARMVCRGECSARELVEASLTAVERLNPRLNAVVTLSAERALREADGVAAGDERPLAGVPIVIKDLALTAGVRTTMGSRAMGDWVPARDGPLVARLRAAGAIVVGKANTAELGLVPVTEPVRFGATLNPWAAGRTAGGSSGGSAAAVAAGMVSLAHGSDGGGSLRVPAACCGLVGLKASRGRVVGESPHGLVTEGALTRTVADAALALEVISATPVGVTLGRDPGRLRIAYTTTPPYPTPVDAACERAVARTAELLTELGHDVVEREPWPDPQSRAWMEDFISVWTVSTAQALDRYGELRGAPLDLAKLEPLTAAMAAEAPSAGEQRFALERLRLYGKRLLEGWERFDVLLTPTAAREPVRVGALAPDPSRPLLEALWKGADFIPFTPVWNLTGQPAISLPLHATAEDLPIGVQLVGAPDRDGLLLALAAQLERARPWAERWPPLAA